ncbi:NAD(P)H-binding protein [Cupriavidus malaysiensis]|uniref:NAD(P)-binding domain-containing protein n=1 Tax=Cupriavidus malaysiensis TaxID=367825 RepID=A0ABM6F0G6_9BURK|nr:NAD(P)H-binding protein [Cupriavidus malaysiensis]AOZ04765.1 hypothetical protein BKK80_02155 [Cupriavidus malaysiensis]
MTTATRDTPPALPAKPAVTPCALRPAHVAVLGAAGGLGQGILARCRALGIGFTAIVRSRPERIGAVPTGSRIAVVPALADGDALARAFAGAGAVLSAVGVTATSQDPSALLSRHLATLESAMQAAGVDRILLVNTLLSAPPGQPASRLMRAFARLPGRMGRGAAELQAVVDGLGAGALSSLRWTLVRAAVNARGRDEAPAAGTGWADAGNSWLPVSYAAMARWMLDEAAACRFVRAAPLVSRRRG